MAKSTYVEDIVDLEKEHNLKACVATAMWYTLNKDTLPLDKEERESALAEARPTLMADAALLIKHLENQNVTVSFKA